MSKNPRGRRPYIPPVTRMELVRTDSKARWIAIAVLLAFGLTAIAFGLFSLLDTQPGWTVIEAAPETVSCSNDFLFRYDFSEEGGSASARNKELSQIYTKATENAFLLFSPDVDSPEENNIRAVNKNPNVPVTVDPVLYHAMEQVVHAGNRMLYLGPVYVEYDRVFQSESDVQAREYDPAWNPEVDRYIQELCGFANQDQHIRLDMLSGNQVMLCVSDAYLEYAEENGIDKFLDFGWMKNAFIVDYLAQTLMDAGYTKGYLASHDGFTRNLDSRGVDYSFNLFDRRDGVVYLPGVMQYQNPVSIVFLRNYPMDELDQWHYYAYEDGNTVTSRIDAGDGRCKSAAENLVSYSYSKSCSEILLGMIPCYVTEQLLPEQVQAMAAQEIFSIWFQGAELFHNGDAVITMDEESGYSLKK